MTVVVGYVPTQTGFSAVTEAERQARWRDVAVVIVNIVGAAGYLVPTAADQPDLDAVVAHLSANGVRNSLRQISDDAAPADIIVARRRRGRRVADRARAPSAVLDREAGARQHGTVSRVGRSCPVLIVPDIDQHSRDGLAAGVDAPPLRSMGQTPPWTPDRPGEDTPRF